MNKKIKTPVGAGVQNYEKARKAVSPLSCLDKPNQSSVYRKNNKARCFHSYTRDLEARWDGIYCSLCNKEMSQFHQSSHWRRSRHIMRELDEESYKKWCAVIDIGFAIKTAIAKLNPERAHTSDRIGDYAIAMQGVLDDLKMKGETAYELRLYD